MAVLVQAILETMGKYNEDPSDVVAVISLIIQFIPNVFLAAKVAAAISDYIKRSKLSKNVQKE